MRKWLYVLPICLIKFFLWSSGDDYNGLIPYTKPSSGKCIHKLSFVSTQSLINSFWWSCGHINIEKQEQHQRGAANGISMAGMSLFKVIGPAAGGTMWVCSSHFLLTVYHIRPFSSAP